MISKEILLEMVRDGLDNGAITKADLAELAGLPEHAETAAHKPETTVPAPVKPTVTADHPNNALTVIDTLFYLAGIIIYAALGAAVAELGTDSITGIFVLLFPGLIFWAGALKFGKQAEQSETSKGLVNALVLSGSLSVISGVMLAANHLVSNSNDSSAAYVYAASLALLGGMHLTYDRFFRHAIPVVIGMYMIIAAFPTVLFGLLASSNPTVDVWALIFMGVGGLAAYGGRIVSKTAPGREYLKGAFLPVAGVLVLGSAYVASLASQAAVVWQVFLPLLIYGAFFYSVKRRSQNFLFTGSLFLALDLITMSFKYFSGLGVSFCLILSAAALLGTAFLSININKRYIKQA